MYIIYIYNIYIYIYAYICMYIYVYIYISPRRKCLKLKTNLFSVKINAKKVVMTFAATVLLNFLSNALFPTSIPSELGILV